MTTLTHEKRNIKRTASNEPVSVYLLTNQTRRDVADACKQLGCTRKQFMKRIKKARRFMKNDAIQQELSQEPLV